MHPGRVVTARTVVRQEELVARAKRTDRTEARRRHRAEQAVLAGVETGSEAEGARAGSAKSSSGSAPAIQRPSITAAFKGAVRPLDLRGDLAAAPRVLANWGVLLAIGLTAAAAAWFAAAYSGGMSAIPVGTATEEQLSQVVGSNNIPILVGQMAFLAPPPAIGAFIIGFAAKRASWLGGLVYGVFVVVVVILLLQSPAGRLLTLDKPGAGDALVLGHAAWSPVGAAIFAAAAAWYRRFLDLSNPNRAAMRQRQEQQRRQSGRGNLGQRPAR